MSRCWHAPGMVALTLMCAATLLTPAATAARTWPQALILDACTLETYVAEHTRSTPREVRFDRSIHAFKARSPVLLRIRHPRILASYRVATEVQVVPPAGVPVSDVDLSDDAPPRPLAPPPPSPPSPSPGAEVQIKPRTVKAVLNALNARDSALQLLLDLQKDQRELLGAADSVLWNLSELRRAVAAIIGTEGMLWPPNRVEPLIATIRTVRDALPPLPSTDVCQSTDPERPLASLADVEALRMSLGRTNSLVTSYRDLRDSARQTNLGRFAVAVQVSVAAFEESADIMRLNLSAVDEALELVNSWSMQPATAGAPLPELTSDQASWVRDVLTPRLRRGMTNTRALLGTRLTAPCAECDPHASGVLPALAHVARQLQTQINRGHDLQCCVGTPWTLASAARAAAVAAEETRTAVTNQLTNLDTAIRDLTDAMETLLTKSRREAVEEIVVGVYHTNALVTYQILEEQPSNVTVQPTELTYTAARQPADAGGRLASEAPDDAPSGDLSRVLAAGVLEIHRTYRLSAFTALAYTFSDQTEYAVRSHAPLPGHGEPSAEEQQHVAVQVGTSRGRIGALAGGKVNFCERGMFPGAAGGPCSRFGLAVGVPVNDLGGLVIGLTIEPFNGLDIVIGRQRTQYAALHSDIEPGVTPLTAPAAGEVSVPFREDPRRWRTILGVGFDVRIFSKLFGQVANIGAALASSQ